MNMIGKISHHRVAADVRRRRMHRRKSASLRRRLRGDSVFTRAITHGAAMFTNPIRWRLQLWLAFLLVFVLTGFGVTVYQLQRVSRQNQIDQELERRVAAISAEVRDRAPGSDRPPRDGNPPRR